MPLSSNVRGPRNPRLIWICWSDGLANRRLRSAQPVLRCGDRHAVTRGPPPNTENARGMALRDGFFAG